MKFRKVRGVCTITLDPESTIEKVATDNQRLLKGFGNLSAIHLKADRVGEIDTAYLQLVLAVFSYAGKNRIPITISETSGAFMSVCELYGVRSVFDSGKDRAEDEKR